MTSATAVLFVVDLELKAGDSELAANVTGQLVGAIVFTECGAEGEPELEVEPPPGEPGNPGDPEPPNEEPPTPNSEEETGCPECFAAGTPVRTDHGNVPIEQIHEDDRVLSRNRETGALEYERVSALIPGHPGKLVDIRVEGETDPLRPSIVHPFWVKRGDAPGAWINAGHMRVGDLLQTIKGDWKRVVSITPEKDSQTVYNFTVDLNHDYFVGETGFLVHNAGGCGCNYRKQFFAVFPYLLGLVEQVHHSIPQAAWTNTQVCLPLKRYTTSIIFGESRTGKTILFIQISRKSGEIFTTRIRMQRETKS